ncbi:MAG: hypothetical protein M8364_16645 [Methylobacter sp.]|uniref:phage tail terminator protein n=1 Tax=Methylobacter sp. TaxID=2051955 RepID=UPI0025882921|nr:hypothetical protein [Methylobacter sp.]MCL7422521.1 hypothetical protein [Methylobacter sp.]
MDNYLAAEDLIKQRLIATVPAIPARNVLSAADLDGVKEAGQATPALHVIYFDDDVPTKDGSSAGSGRDQITRQLWLVTLVVRNVRDKAGAGIRNDAGLVIGSVLSSLQGWQPSAEHGPLQRRKSPYRPTYRNGFAYFTFLFSTQIFVKAVTE